MCQERGPWLAQSVEHATLGLRIVSSSPMLGMETTLKKKKKKRNVSTMELDPGWKIL